MVVSAVGCAAFVGPAYSSPWSPHLAGLSCMFIWRTKSLTVSNEKERNDICECYQEKVDKFHLINLINSAGRNNVDNRSHPAGTNIAMAASETRASDHLGVVLTIRRILHSFSEPSKMSLLKTDRYRT